MLVTQLTGRVMAGMMTPRAQLFIQRVIENSRILGVMNNWKLTAHEGQYRPAVGGQTLAGRAVNSNYTATNMNPAALVPALLDIVGFILKYDATYVRDNNSGLGIDMELWYDQELEERAIDTAEAIDKELISGDGSSNTIVGILNLLTAGSNLPGLGITGVIDILDVTGTAGDSFDLSNPDNYDPFMEAFEKVKKDVDRPEAVILNDSFAARLTTIARKFHRYSTRMDEFGNTVERIDGLDIVALPDDVITKLEPDNAGSPVENTTSMLVTANREGQWEIRSNSGLALYDVGMLQGEMAEAIKFELTAKNVIRRKRSIRRVRNIKLD